MFPTGVSVQAGGPPLPPEHRRPCSAQVPGTRASPVSCCRPCLPPGKCFATAVHTHTCLQASSHETFTDRTQATLRVEITPHTHTQVDTPCERVRCTASTRRDRCVGRPPGPQSSPGTWTCPLRQAHKHILTHTVALTTKDPLTHTAHAMLTKRTHIQPMLNAAKADTCALITRPTTDAREHNHRRRGCTKCGSLQALFEADHVRPANVATVNVVHDDQQNRQLDLRRMGKRTHTQYTRFNMHRGPAPSRRHRVE